MIASGHENNKGYIQSKKRESKRPGNAGLESPDPRPEEN